MPDSGRGLPGEQRFCNGKPVKAVIVKNNLPKITSEIYEIVLYKWDKEVCYTNMETTYRLRQYRIQRGISEACDMRG